MKSLRIRIVGGSLAGLFAGILLSREGHDVKVYERSSSGLAGRGAGLVPQQEVFQILREIGVEHLASFGVVSRDRVYLARDGGIDQNFNSPQTQISWDLLYAEALGRLEASRYVLGRQVVRVSEEPGHAIIAFDDGTDETADLVIGADGIGSVVRGTLNSQPENRYSGYVAWRGLIPETRLPRRSSILIGNFTFYIAHGVHVLGYLVPGPNGEIDEGKRRYNWVWYRFVEQGMLQELFTGQSRKHFRFSLPRGEPRIDDLNDLRQSAEIALPPQFQDAVLAEPEPSIQGIFDFEASRMAGRSVALIGDAAFVVRPHTAMGVGKAAGDVFALRNAMREETDLPMALARYNRERIEVGRAIARYGRDLAANAFR